MKKIITLFLFCIFTIASAQHKVGEKIVALQKTNVTFHSFEVLSAQNVTPTDAIANTVGNATFAKINLQSVNDIVANQYEAIEIAVPYNGSIIKVSLYKVDLFNQNFHIDTDKSKDVAYTKGVHYRGIVNGDPMSTASLNFFKNELNGIVSSATFNNLVIGKMALETNVMDYIVYSDLNLKIPNNFNCGVKDDANVHNHDEPSTSREALTQRCVTMYFEIDHNIFLNNNANVATTTNWMTSVYNNVQTLYENDGITTSLKSLFIWTEDDPYEGTTSYEHLYQFNAFRPVFDGDVGQLVSMDEGGLGGVAATIEGLCSQNNFSYSDVDISFSSVPLFSWTIQVITHEFGHLLGSRHTHACVWNGNGTSIDGCGTQAGYNEGNCVLGPIPNSASRGTIMSYCHLIQGVGINLANGFGPQPTAAIIAAVESSTCLSTDCINTCINTVATVEITNLTNTSATITWNDFGSVATQWQVNVYGPGSPASVWNTVSTNSFTTVFPLVPNTFYTIRVRPVCSSGSIPYARELRFATPADWCNGVVVSDSGGINGLYDDMESYVRTFTPSEPGKKIRLEFSEIDLEDDFDFIYVYDGPTTGSPQIIQITGNVVPSEIISTAPDGSLTLEFSSDQAVNGNGYAALVSCDDRLGLSNFSGIDFTYYPNPANDVVNISAKIEMTTIAVYNITGQLLYNRNINAMDSKVDISEFSTGTYFFKLKFGDKEANFKIIKN